MATAQATTMPIHRCFHMPFPMAESWPINSSISSRLCRHCPVPVWHRPPQGGSVATRMWLRSEPALRDDQDVSRLHLDVAGNVAALDEVLQADRILLVAFGGAQDRSRIAVGEVGEAAHGDHHVQERH